MFTTFIVQPIFNLLVLITALIPGHNFGLAIIIFTILVRILMWPLLKKQLHNAKALRELQPELKKIREATKGDRQKQYAMTSELYKEREVKPFRSLFPLLVQIPILIGLFFAVRRLVEKPKDIVDFSYSWLQDFSWLKELGADIGRFDETLFGIMDLTKPAVGDGGAYLPALLLVAASAIAQYFQSKQLMPRSKDARSLKQILKEAGKGKSADQDEVNAAVGRSMLYIIPLFVFIFSLGFPAALPLYWFTSSAFAYWQQGRILKEDVDEISNATTVTISQPSETDVSKSKKRQRSKSARGKKRRKR